MRAYPAALFILTAAAAAGADHGKSQPPTFRTSDRCLACHNGLVTPSGEDVSIGFAWRASIMANSSRDPYWQASVRREILDHPESRAVIEDDCSVCHMPITRFEARLRGLQGEVFSHLPFDGSRADSRRAADGVSCSVCHQISKRNFGARESFNGGFAIDPPNSPTARPEYGPFNIEPGHQRIMRTSTGGFQPTEQTHIRESELCATCHTLYTQALGAGGKVIGELPEQMPYREWLHSDYRGTQSCQDCHMPEVSEATPITVVFGTPRQGLHRHSFVGGNCFMLGMLNRWRGELSVAALPRELNAGSQETIALLQSRAARVGIPRAEVSDGQVRAEVVVENLAGHKLPTAYPSRRAWLHVTIRDRNGRAIFESGALRPDGSIDGNDNDADAGRFEPHYNEIHNRDQVQIYESILKDEAGRVTTGLLAAVDYLKDNRIPPDGFDKRTADKDIAVRGGAAEDSNFAGGSDRVLYSAPASGALGPFEVEAELWYQPVGYRWANNLKAYSRAEEPRRFNRYYDAMASATAVVLARASARTGRD